MPQTKAAGNKQVAERLHTMRHSAAHVLATAMLEYIPEAKLTIGPAIDDGFYYDFDLPRTLAPDDIEELSRRMRRIIDQDQQFAHSTMPVAEAKEFFRKQGQTYKVELIEDLEREAQIETVSIYQMATSSIFVKDRTWSQQALWARLGSSVRPAPTGGR